MVGRGVAVDNDVRIGARVRIQTNAYITAGSVIEDDVFIAPGVVLTNDPRAGRGRPGRSWWARCSGAPAGSARGAVLLPGRGGRGGGLRGAGAVVTRDVPAARGGDGRARRRGARGAGGGAAVMRRRRRRPRRRTAPRSRWASRRPAAARPWRSARSEGSGGAAPRPRPSEAGEPAGRREEAVAETAQVAREGYRQVSTRENALFNMLASFATTFLATRWITYVLRGRPRVGPFRNVRVGRRHIHHFVPGIVLAFASGAAAILTRERGARAEARRAVRGRDGPHARRVGPAARAGRRLLAPGGAPERADHARRDRAALGAGAWRCACSAAGEQVVLEPAAVAPRSLLSFTPWRVATPPEPRLPPQPRAAPPWPRPEVPALRRPGAAGGWQPRARQSELGGSRWRLVEPRGHRPAGAADPDRRALRLSWPVPWGSPATTTRVGRVHRGLVLLGDPGLPRLIAALRAAADGARRAPTTARPGASRSWASGWCATRAASRWTSAARSCARSWSRAAVRASSSAPSPRHPDAPRLALAAVGRREPRAARHGRVSHVVRA